MTNQESQKKGNGTMDEFDGDLREFLGTKEAEQDE
jgi:hypothetical protein